MTLHPTRTEVVRLRFKDGEILEPKLVSVDHYDDGEINYDLSRRVTPPAPRAGRRSSQHAPEAGGAAASYGSLLLVNVFIRRRSLGASR